MAIEAITLSKSIQTAAQINSYLQNITNELQSQTVIYQELLQRLYALEAAVTFLGKHQEALWTRQQLTCDAGFHIMCMTPIPLSNNQSWYVVRKHLAGIFKNPLQHISDLQSQLRSQFKKLQQETKNATINDLYSALNWLNPSNWFHGIGPRLWTMLGGLLILLLCVFIGLCLIVKIMRRLFTAKAFLIALLQPPHLDTALPLPTLNSPLIYP